MSWKDHSFTELHLHWLLWEYEYLHVCRVMAHADSKDMEFLFQFHVRQNFIHGICSYLKETVLMLAKKK